MRLVCGVFGGVWYARRGARLPSAMSKGLSSDVRQVLLGDQSGTPLLSPLPLTRILLSGTAKAVGCCP